MNVSIEKLIETPEECLRFAIDHARRHASTFERLHFMLGPTVNSEAHLEQWQRLESAFQKLYHEMFDGDHAKLADLIAERKGRIR